MYLKYVNTVYFVFKYKIHFEFTSNTKYKIHRMYVFEILIFEILYNSGNTT